MSSWISGRKRAVMAGCALSVLALASQAAAQSKHRYQVQGGSLDSALKQFARQTDQEILFNNRLLVGKKTEGFNGEATAPVVLERLLANSGLTYTSSATGALLVVKYQAEPQPATPPPRPPAAAASQTPTSVREAPAAPEPVSTVEELVVTGSLVVRDGYQAPTPVTVVEATALQRAAPTNIPDGLNQLPQFAGSRNQNGGSLGTVTFPTSGNYLNLRNLGINRSLILLDGQRVPPTSYEGIVDTNILPQALIQRVDVVTAGASATYGSDALTGVVNFILDKKFTGLKGSLQGGLSQQNDNNSWRASIAAGTPILGGRGHLLFSAEHYKSDGVKSRTQRDIFNTFPIAFGNGTTVPYRIEYNARYSQTTHGGLILTGPLAYQKFENDGRLTPFDKGNTLGGVQIGGDGGRSNRGALTGGLMTDQLFSRVSYDFTEKVRGFAQGTFGESRIRYCHNGFDNRLGNLTIFSGNAFLRPEVQAQLTAAGTASFMMGRQGGEQGCKQVDFLSDSVSLFTGLEGEFGDDWRWKLGYSAGNSILRAEHTRNPQNRNYFAALDAVRNPVNGQIVCRVTLTNPDRYPGCVPLNLFGVDNASREAIEYAFGADSQYKSNTRLDDVAVSLAGSPFSLWAGPVSIALGAEVRKEQLRLASNADPAFPQDLTGIRGYPSGQGRFGNTNVGTANGEVTVKEAFGEVAVPLLNDLPLIQTLEFNGAFRITDYSTSGQVETYKAGFNYVPMDDIRVRATVSRDIRAPSLNELFAGASLNTQPLQDVHTGVSGVIQTVTSGDLGLTPEIGMTSTVGVVYRPSWLRGFTASIDYYNIEIKDAIATTNAATQNQDCETSGGTAPVCAFIFRPFPFSDRSRENMVQRVQISPVNLSETYTHGLDMEAGYRISLADYFEGSDATLDLRVLANYTPSKKVKQSPTSAPRQDAGIGGGAGVPFGGPKWRTVLSANYNSGPWNVNVQERVVGKMIRSNQPSVRFQDNDLEAVYYTDVTVAYKFKVDDHDLEAFLSINNALDRDFPVVPPNNEPGLGIQTIAGTYDTIGRMYTAGIRFKY